MAQATIPTVVSLVGARPQFVKLAPVHHELLNRGIQHDIVHSGQHYDHQLSDEVFRDLNIPQPKINLHVGSGGHAHQTARMISRFDSALNDLHPDVVLIYGDTNTTLAGALVVSKRTEFLVHVEAGLRSFDRRMPEENNRIVADHLSDLLLAPTNVAMKLLDREGLAEKSRYVGDVMVDVLNSTLRRVAERPPSMPGGWVETDGYVLATLHREENTDDPGRLRELVSRLGDMHHDVRLAVHPRLNARMNEFDISVAGGLSLWPPLSYPQTVRAISKSMAVVTDSGGLQKEAALIGRPCITARHETEWVETVETEWNVIDPNLTVPLSEWVTKTRVPFPSELFGDGNAARRIVDEVLESWEKHRG